MRKFLNESTLLLLTSKHLRGRENMRNTSLPHLEEKDHEVGLLKIFEEVPVKIKSRGVLSAYKLYTDLKSRFIIKNFPNLAIVSLWYPCQVLSSD